MVDRYLRGVQGARHRLAPVGSDLRSRRSRPGENRVSQVQVGTTCTGHERSAITQIANGRARQYREYWRDRGRRETTFAAVATPTLSHVQPPAATRLAGDIDRPSRKEVASCWTRRPR